MEKRDKFSCVCVKLRLTRTIQTHTQDPLQYAPVHLRIFIVFNLSEHQTFQFSLQVQLYKNKQHLDQYWHPGTSSSSTVCRSPPRDSTEPPTPQHYASHLIQQHVSSLKRAPPCLGLFEVHPPLLSLSHPLVMLLCVMQLQ